MCKNGFHFCNTLEETLQFYPLKDSRFFRIETDGKVITSLAKNVAEKIKLVEEITDNILDEFIKSNSYNTRAELAKYGRPQDLDILIYDENWQVRCKVAKQKRAKDLDILVKDEDKFVRYAVAEHNRPQDLEILKNDADPSIAQYAQKKLKELKK